MLPTVSDIEHRFAAQYGDLSRHGWRVRMQRRFGYYSPQLVYETLVESLVSEETRWLDVGGGKSLFPNNHILAESLAGRCKRLVGVDPSDNIHENPYVHEQAQCRIEDYMPAEPFNLATLRMVAEHMAQPKAVVGALGRMLSPGGFVVVYTPNKWSVASIAARMIPNAWHHRLTHWLWNTREEDVFPTVYRLNTRRDLTAPFAAGGFRLMPMPGEQSLDPRLVETIESGGMTFVDCRSLRASTKGHYPDGYHMDPVAAVIYSRAVADAMASHLEPPCGGDE